jgi:hypothetical protein
MFLEIKKKNKLRTFLLSLIYKKLSFRMGYKYIVEPTATNIRRVLD